MPTLPLMNGPVKPRPIKTNPTLRNYFFQIFLPSSRPRSRSWNDLRAICNFCIFSASSYGRTPVLRIGERLSRGTPQRRGPSGIKRCCLILALCHRSVGRSNPAHVDFADAFAIAQRGYCPGQVVAHFSASAIPGRNHAELLESLVMGSTQLPGRGLLG